MSERDYCEFFETQDEAIEHCRKRNRGLSSQDERCLVVVDGPGCGDPDHKCCAYAVVDLETAREFNDDFGVPYLVVTQ